MTVEPGHTATLSFEYPSPAVARTVERSVRPEVGAVDDGRSQASLARDDDTVEVRIDAADLVALRASTNTWVRLVETAETARRLADDVDGGGAPRRD